MPEPSTPHESPAPAPENDATHAKANPPRFRWLIRLSVLGVLGVLMVAGLRLYWGWAMQQRLDAIVADIAATGEPIHFGDLKQSPVPDADNKVYFLREAMAQWPSIPGRMIQVTDSAWFNEGYDPETRISLDTQQTDPIPDQAAYLQACAPAIALLEQARDAPYTHWGTPPTNPPMHGGPTYYQSMRNLTRLINDAAERALLIGDETTAMHLLLLQMQNAGAIISPEQVFMGTLIEHYTIGMSGTLMWEHINTLKLQDPKARNAIEQIIHLSLDTQRFDDRLAEIMRSERWAIYHNGIHIAQHPFAHQWGNATNNTTAHLIRVFFEPVFLSDTYQMLSDANTLHAISLKTHNHEAFFQQATAGLGYDPLNPPRITSDFEEILRPIAELYQYNWQFVGRFYFHSVAHRRLRATAWAIRLYELDHGHRPETLEQLVPDYLPYVPTDPAIDGELPLLYKPEGAPAQWNPDQYSYRNPPGPLDRDTVAVVYSRGLNYIDDGGAVMLREGYNGKPVDIDWGYVDEWVYALEPLPQIVQTPITPATPPATTQPSTGGQILQDEKDVEQNDGDNPQQESAQTQPEHGE